MGTWATTESHRRGCMDMDTSSLMWSCLLMVISLCLDLGTRPSVCGISLLGRPLVGSRTTPRTSSPWLSLQTTDKSCPQLETKPSSSGTLWPNVNTPSKRTDIKTGCRAQVLSQQSESHHRLRWLGQIRQGLEFDQLQVEDQPYRSYRLPEH